MSSQEPDWKRLWELAEVLLGSAEAVKKESVILARLYRQFGAADVERLLIGAKLLGWRSLRGLGSAEGAGRRMALERYWKSENKAPSRLEALGAILKKKGLL